MKLSDAQAAVGILCTACGWFFGGFDGILLTLVALTIADYLSGVAAAVKNKKVSSRIGAAGIARKIIMFVLVGIANIVGIFILGDGTVIRTAVIIFYISNEGISLIENAGILGLPVPDVLKKALLKNAENVQAEKDDNDAG